MTERRVTEIASSVRRWANNGPRLHDGERKLLHRIADELKCKDQPGEPKEIKQKRKDVRFERKCLDDLLSGNCIDCGANIPIGFNLCARCGDERGP